MATTQDILPQSDVDEHGPVLDATHARQGRRGLHVLWILGISMVLVVLALGVIWSLHAPGLSGPSGQGMTDGRSFNAPQPQALPSDVGQPASQTPRTGTP
jgi:hypothetical protein